MSGGYNSSLDGFRGCDTVFLTLAWPLHLVDWYSFAGQFDLIIQCLAFRSSRC